MVCLFCVFSLRTSSFQLKHQLVWSSQQHVSFLIPSFSMETLKTASVCVSQFGTMPFNQQAAKKRPIEKPTNLTSSHPWVKGSPQRSRAVTWKKCEQADSKRCRNTSNPTVWLFCSSLWVGGVLHPGLHGLSSSMYPTGVYPPSYCTFKVA